MSNVYINSSMNVVSWAALFGLKLITGTTEETFPTNCWSAFKTTTTTKNNFWGVEDLQSEQTEYHKAEFKRIPITENSILRYLSWDQ